MTNNLIVITGPRGVGKTLLAATYAPPSEIGSVYWHDSENSANHIIDELRSQDLSLGRYVNLSARFRDISDDADLLERINRNNLPWVNERGRRSLEEYYRYILADLDKNLVPNKYKIYVHDTLEKLEAGMQAWVEDNRRASGWKSAAYGGMWVHGYYPLYQQLLDAIFARGVETIILTSHLKTPWEGNRPLIGKVTPAGKKILHYLSSLYIWLVHEPNNADGAPAGIVLKERMGKLRPDESTNTWSIHKTLPQRIPHCTWKDINEYLENGTDLKNPLPGEVLTEDERAMISDSIPDKLMELQIALVQQEIEEQRAEARSIYPDGNASSPSTEQYSNNDIDPEEVYAMSKLMRPQEIARKLDIPLPKVIATLRNRP